nr:serine/threonine-protein kinase mph1 [Quercus suber]
MVSSTRSTLLLRLAFRNRRTVVAHVAIVSFSKFWKVETYLTQHGPHGDTIALHHDIFPDNSVRATGHARSNGHIATQDTSSHDESVARYCLRKKRSCIGRSLRRAMAAIAHPTRPHFRRNSPISALDYGHGISTVAARAKRIDLDDSDSDDELPPEIKFSKYTQALLDDVPLPSSPSRQDRDSDVLRINRSASAPKDSQNTPSRAPLRVIRRTSPPALGEKRGNTPPRVIHIGSKNLGSAGKRSISISGPYVQLSRREPTPEASARPELITPAPAVRIARSTRSRAGSDASDNGQIQLQSSALRSGSANRRNGGADSGDRRSELSRTTSQHVPETVSRYGPPASRRPRNISGDTSAPPGSQARKPNGGLTMKPIRRGFRRRESEDNISPSDEAQTGSAPASQPSGSSYTPRDGSLSGTEEPRNRSGSINTRATSVEPVSVHDFAREPGTTQDPKQSVNQPGWYFSRSQTNSDSRPRSRQGHLEQQRSRQSSAEPPQHRRLPSLQHVQATANAPSSILGRRSSIDREMPNPASIDKSHKRVPSLGRAQQYKYVTAPKTHTDALEDQENVPPPTFKRNNNQEFKYLGKPSIDVLPLDANPKQRPVEETPVPVHHQQEPRKALGAISGNTPHRVAPAPPPKMSVLETATATAGAGVTKSKKKRSHIVVNGKIFTQMGRLGKGGSSDVYQVMAENYKTFALKRVKLEDCDESAVRGYKGEIDLLNRLKDVERVVRLFDWELNDAKHELFVLMEKGETDLNRLLTLRLNGTDANFDCAFTRFYWREMLDCVQAVHEHDIVHSDLKPANFLLVQGRLKLIDFGIANAIETDHTVNVHRDSHVGTPNYMSPESITDTNAPQPGQPSRDAAGRPLKKDMRIGKASDVWSLGCILYQMTYGRPPFAHIANQISRIMAITNPKHVIEFPETGVGGAFVPPSLRLTLRRCLNRDPESRPKIPDLLSERDTYLNPDPTAHQVLVSEELMGQIITKIVQRCGDKSSLPPTQPEIDNYARTFVARISEKQAGG